jgi:hypothetical protein
MGAALRIEPQSVVLQADAAGLGVVVHGVSLMRSTPLSPFIDPLRPTLDRYLPAHGEMGLRQNPVSTRYALRTTDEALSPNGMIGV